VSSEWFRDGGSLPGRCTVDGEGVAPPLSWTRPAGGTQAVVLICEDPDAPLPEPFVHWLVYGIPADLQHLDVSTRPRAHEGQNSKLKSGFTPAAPPPGHGLHHYHFQIFALDTRVHLENGVGRGKLLEAMRGHVLQWGELVGIYQRQ
jgi:Raf kinase inhibitor-like YbhB/YbcL family protein